MSKRRLARERAVQYLFQYDVNPPENLDADIQQFWDDQKQPPQPKSKTSTHAENPAPESSGPDTEEAAMQLFAEALIRGVIQHRSELDEQIKKYAKNWDLHRMAVVDRNVLRLGLFEMLHREDIPPVVSINEAVDIAKKYSTEDSGKFVNGILDRFRTDLLRPARTAKEQ